MTGYFHAAPRPLAQSDAEAVRALVLGTIGVTPYVDRVLDIAKASNGSDSENHGLITERDGTVAALALFGPVAGAEGVWHLSTLLLAPRIEVRDVGGALLDAVTAYVRQRKARVLIAELPADPAIGSSLSLLRARGFRQEARIPDFFRDGVPLLFLRMNF
jgi:ribosomal protein S18 acetylase RimI-like enzyme